MEHPVHYITILRAFPTETAADTAPRRGTADELLLYCVSDDRQTDFAAIGTQQYK